MNQQTFKQQDYHLLSKVFSRSVVSELAKKKKSILLTDIISELNLVNSTLLDSSLYDFFDRAYRILVNNYRNEYIYKNAIASKLIRGKHKLANASYVTEFKTSNSIADVAVFNGTSTAYEIKTEYDSFDRLNNQLDSYSKVFDKIYVVIPPTSLERLTRIIPDNVGICILTERYTLVEEKEAKSNIQNICTSEILNSMRHSEYIEVLKEHFDFSFSLSPKKQKMECLELFSFLGPEVIHRHFVNKLKSRMPNKNEKKIIKNLPTSLTSQILSFKMNERSLKNLRSCMMEPLIL